MSETKTSKTRCKRKSPKHDLFGLARSKTEYTFSSAFAFQTERNFVNILENLPNNFHVPNRITKSGAALVHARNRNFLWWISWFFLFCTSGDSHRRVADWCFVAINCRRNYWWSLSWFRISSCNRIILVDPIHVFCLNSKASTRISAVRLVKTSLLHSVQLRTNNAKTHLGQVAFSRNHANLQIVASISASISIRRSDRVRRRPADGTYPAAGSTARC